MALMQEELERYARHIVLADLGGVGQQKLKTARVLVIGAGGLGSPLIQYLAAAGVGTIGIVDDDEVSLSNLQRQVLHSTEQVGTRKTESAADSVQKLNPHVTIEPWPLRLSEENALALIAQYDLVADGCDNFETRYAVADACAAMKKTLVSAAVSQFDGTLTTFKPFETDANGNSYSSYRDLYPKPPSADDAPTCEEAGIIGALTGIIGSMQALEVIKEIAEIGDSMAGRLLMFDGRAMRFETISY